MDKKVILISIDGMRPDGLKQCGNPYVKELEKYHDKLRLAEEKKKHFEPYVEKALSFLVVGVLLLLAVADSKNKKKIEEQMKLKKQKKKKEKKKKKDTTEIVE